MKKLKKDRSKYWKLGGGMVGFVAIGVALLLASLAIRASVATADVTTQPAAAAPVTAPNPVTVPDSAPAEPAATQPVGNGPNRPTRDSDQAAKTNMAGVLLLFSMLAFLLAITCAILLGVEIRRSRPAWKKQTRYPRHDDVVKSQKSRKPPT